MRSIRTRLERVAVALACSAVLVATVPLGCAPSLRSPNPGGESPDAPPKHGGTLRLASLYDVRNLDPAGPPEGLADQAVRLLFDGLVDFDMQSRAVPGLAERWTIEDDGRTYRFELRQGVRMHDGGELTADDVKRSVERALRPTTPNPNASLFEGIEGYPAYTAGKAPHLDGVSVDGRYAVSFHLTQPDGAFLALLAIPSMRPVCATAKDRYVDGWLPCGAGPFKLEPGGWQRGASLRVVRHDGYFRPGLPYLDAVEWTFGMSVVSQRFRFEDGDLDLLYNPTYAEVSRFMADSRWHNLGLSLADVISWGEAMNTRMAPFDNVEVRRAVAAAIRRDHLATLMPSNVSVLTQLLPRGLPGYDATFVGQRYDEAAALEHMRRAGYPYDPTTGTGGYPRPITYTVTEPSFESFASQLLQQDLSRIGLRITVRPVTFPAYLAITQREGASVMHAQGNQPDYPDPSTFFDSLFTSSAIAPEGTSNTAFYSNPRYDDVVARARHAMDPDVRRSLYREANEILCDDAPWAFDHGVHHFVMRQPYVRGLVAHPVWTFDVRAVWLDHADTTLPGPLAGARR